MDKLLLIDDEADVRYSFERIFGQEAGLELHTAGSGEEALGLIPLLRPDRAPPRPRRGRIRAK